MTRIDSTSPLVFVGSSIIALWESLPRSLAGAPVLNTAVGGAQTPDILARLEDLVIQYAPRAVCYYCGSNDINNEASSETIVANVVQTYETLCLRLEGLKFVYLSII